LPARRDVKSVADIVEREQLLARGAIFRPAIEAAIQPERAAGALLPIAVIVHQFVVAAGRHRGHRLRLIEQRNLRRNATGKQKRERRGGGK